LPRARRCPAPSCSALHRTHPGVNLGEPLRSPSLGNPSAGARRRPPSVYHVRKRTQRTVHWLPVNGCRSHHIDCLRVIASRSLAARRPRRVSPARPRVTCARPRCSESSAGHEPVAHHELWLMGVCPEEARPGLQATGSASRQLGATGSASRQLGAVC